MSDQHFLGTVDDEVASRVEWTLVQLSQITIVETTEEAVRRTQHDWDLADERLQMLRLNWILLIGKYRLGYVHIQRRRVPEQTQSNDKECKGLQCDMG